MNYRHCATLILGWAALLTFAVLGLQAVAGCSAVIGPDFAVGGRATDCDSAQARLDELGCAEAKTPGGTSFGESCRRARKDGRDWCAAEIAQVKSCDEVEGASLLCQ